MAYYSDLDMELTMAQDGDVTLDVDMDAVQNAITNIVRTIQGGRRMLPRFAFNAYQLLFEPLTQETGNRIANAMWDVIEEGEPRVKIEGINISIDYDNSRYNATLTYTILNITQETEEISLILEKL